MHILHKCLPSRQNDKYFRLRIPHYSLSSNSCGVKKLACLRIVCACMKNIFHGAVPERKNIFYVKAIMYSY